MDALFTFPNVPSAISPITVYSPSLYAGYIALVSMQWTCTHSNEPDKRRILTGSSFLQIGGGDEALRKSLWQVC